MPTVFSRPRSLFAVLGTLTLAGACSTFPDEIEDGASGGKAGSGGDAGSTSGGSASGGLPGTGGSATGGAAVGGAAGNAQGGAGSGSGGATGGSSSGGSTSGGSAGSTGGSTTGGSGGAAGSTAGGSGGSAGSGGSTGTTCGDGRIEPGEECDDGGTAPGDGCSAKCEVMCSDFGSRAKEDTLPDGSKHCYWLDPTPLAFEQAKGVCGAGHIVTILSEQENTTVGSLMLPVNPPWIGAVRPGLNQPFEWVTGEPWGYFKWQLGEPDGIDSDADDAFCSVYTQTGWTDRYCNANLATICEYTPPRNP